MVVNSYKVNCVYPAFQGEVNVKGIGAPVIFVRLQGCHLRCYKETMGTLCDTPEALEGTSDCMHLQLPLLMQMIDEVSEKMGGVKFICLTGGDPLWRKASSLDAFFYACLIRGYQVSVETSGTLPMHSYRHHSHVTWVLDYKLKSAGVDRPFLHSEIKYLDCQDFIKFVVYDTEDYAEFKAKLLSLTETKATIAVGTYWGGKMTTMELYNRLIADKLLGKVVLNVQLHKMAFAVDTFWNSLPGIKIPEQL